MKVVKRVAFLFFVFLISRVSGQTQLGGDINGSNYGDYCGYKVSLSSSGSRLAVGSPAKPPTSAPGTVKVYSLSGSSWTQMGSDIDGENNYDFSGSSVSLSADGNTVAIGAIYNPGGGNTRGHVRVYTWSGSAWTKLGADIDGENNNDLSGYSVAISADGTTVAIGAPYNAGNGNQAGHVRVYHYSSGSWTQVGSDIDGEAAGDRSGFSVSLSADGYTVAIGAPFNNGSGGSGNYCGQTRIYHYSSSTWTKIGSDIDGDGGDKSGWSVSLSSNGNVVAIGAVDNNSSAGQTGNTRVYSWSGSAWSQLGSDIDGEADLDYFGCSVALSSDGHKVVIGAEVNSGNGSESGHARMYTFNGTAWVKVGSDIDGKSAGDHSGFSVSISGSGDTVAIGSPYHAPVWTGQARVFIKSPVYEYYVDGSLSASGDGSSWATAFKTLSEALDSVWKHPEITAVYVAKGTYVPSTLPYNMAATQKGTLYSSSDNRDKTFHIRPGLEVYGGFPNGGGTRNPKTNLTILSGKNVGGVSGDSAYHVVLMDSSNYWATANDTTVLDGFVIQDGKTATSTGITLNSKSIFRTYAGGIYIMNVTCKISNCVIQNNQCKSSGGGVYHDQADLDLSYTDFKNNNAGTIAGGIMLNSGKYRVTHCNFENNTAVSEGGALYNLEGNVNIDSCKFTGNHSITRGGAIKVHATGKVTLYGCTFTNNYSSFGGAVAAIINGTITASHCVFMNDSAAWGSAIYSSSGGMVTAHENYFYSNKGTAVNVNYTSVNIYNNLFYNNTTPYSGPCINFLEVSGVLANNTFFKNHSNTSGSGAMDIANSTLTISNNLFYGNTIFGSDTLPGCDFFSTGTGHNFYNNSLQSSQNQYTSANHNNLGSSVSGNLYKQNPYFANASDIDGADDIIGTEDDGLRIGSISKLVDAGDSTKLSGVENDFAGKDRIQGTNINPGAYEDTVFIPCFPALDTIDVTYCSLYPSPSGKYFWSTSGTYLDTVTTNGCDTFLTINLTILEASYDTIAVYGCETYTSPSGIYHWTSNGIYRDTLVAANTCDSILLINLTILFPTHDTVTINATGTFISASGKSITQSGTFLDTTTNQYGCDSILTYEVSIIKQLFVDGNAADAGNGGGWGSPFTNLKDAVNAANTSNDPVEIWVKEGTYYPTDDGSSGRTSTFLLTNINTKLYGGFDGSETSRDQRDPVNNRTVISGDIGTPGNPNDNSFHVLTVIDNRTAMGGEEPLDTSFVIDGFVITGGNADGASKSMIGGKNIWKNQGGGLLIYSDAPNRQMSPLVNNCVFEVNYADYGAAVYIEVPNGSSHAEFTGCVFKNNTALYGAFYNNGNNGVIKPVLTNCVFDQNLANTSGAGIYNYGYNGDASPTVLNCVFSQNTAITQGGAIYNSGYAGVCSTYVANCTFFANSAGSAGGVMYNNGNSGSCTPTVVNCAMNNNQAGGFTTSNKAEIYNFNAYPVFSYCAMQLQSIKYTTSNFNNLGGSNNLFQVSPSFTNSSSPVGSDGIWMTSDDGLIPNSSSPLINAGTNSGTPAKDIRGINRSGNRDIGAYEKP